ncbi:MAG: methyltransferase [Ktedonobacterales bacterium]
MDTTPADAVHAASASTEPTQPTLVRLRRRLARRYALREAPIPIPGAPTPYVITLPADPDAPLDHLAHLTQPTTHRRRTGDQEDAASAARRAVVSGAHLPYWALLWPSGMALAEALLAAPDAARGRRTLEVGCGLGVTATATLACGARLLVADLFSEALHFCRYNTLRNSGHAPRALAVNWRAATGQAALIAAGPFDLLLAADVLYEAEDEQPLLALVPQLLTPGGACWLAEPGRRVAQSFVAAALARGWHDAPTTYARHWPDEEHVSRVTVHRFTLPAYE